MIRNKSRYVAMAAGAAVFFLTTPMSGLQATGQVRVSQGDARALPKNQGHAARGDVGLARARAEHYGLPAEIGPLGLYRIRIPMPPKGYYPNLQPDYASGFLRSGDVVVDMVYADARYDPVHHRYLRGTAGFGSDSGFAVAGRGQSVWITGGRMGVTWVEHSGFNRDNRNHGAAHTVQPVGGQTNGIVSGNDGDAWVAGWRVKNQGIDWLDTGELKRHAKGLPNETPQGWSALFFLRPKTGVARTLHVPANGPLTGVAMYHQYVWAIDPYTRCRKQGRHTHCSRSRFVRYNTETHHFAVFKFPPTIHIKPVGDLYYQTPMASAPDGSVWATVSSGPFRHGRFKHALDVSLIGYRNGHVIQHHLWWTGYWGYGYSVVPRVDAQGRIWLGSREVINPRTWHVTMLHHVGAVFQGAGRTMWSITGP